MRRIILLSALVTVLLLAIVPTALAWTPVVGCTYSGDSSDPGPAWSWGGSVTARQFATGIVVGSGTLDANGCYSFPIGNGPKVLVTVDFNPGPAGDPPDQYCVVPTDTDYWPLPYHCAPIYTETGPNAVALSGFGASASSNAPALLALAAVLGAAVLFIRRR